MEDIITCFIPLGNYDVKRAALNILEQGHISRIYFLSDKEKTNITLPNNCSILKTDSLYSDNTLRCISQLSQTPYTLIQLSDDEIEFSYKAIRRFIDFISQEKAGVVYSNYYEIKKNIRNNHPVNDYQKGSVRDNFDFGSIMIYKTEIIKDAVSKINKDVNYNYSALYYLRLFTSIIYDIIHINEFLYTKKEHDIRTSGEKMFDYVNPKNRDVQIEMENVFTNYLARIDAKLHQPHSTIDINEYKFEKEASVIIPVRNRVKTIADAIKSALNQTTSFDYNIIIVDNHSTDGTTEVIKNFNDNKIVHLVPERLDLGIGGCWDLAINNQQCGRFAIQLDSDDIYSDENTLQKIVDGFYQQKCAMIVGSYKMTDFNLNDLPPGIIDHKEWSDKNGMNNALRINGLGAPRAFYTPILRKIGVPNVSYGEDYALGITISRNYKIGRIYDVLYLCRRWEGNSDSSLSIEKLNINNNYKDSLRSLEIEKRIYFNKIYHHLHSNCNNSLINADVFIKDQLKYWKLAKENHNALKALKIKDISINDYPIVAQCNLKRIVSSGAKLDKKSIETRKCFLCEENQPKEQNHYYLKGINEYNLCINPYPILKGHLTIPSIIHRPQQLEENEYRDMLSLAHAFKKHIFFFNGDGCGASAPDHFHFQAVYKSSLPIFRIIKSKIKKLKNIDTITAFENELKKDSSLFYVDDYIAPLFIIKSNDSNLASVHWNKLESIFNECGINKGMYNLFIGEDDKGATITMIIPRSKHRPKCFYKDGKEQIVVSPGALDMAGIIVIAREEDFKKITREKIISIMKEVSPGKSTINKIIKKITNK